MVLEKLQIQEDHLEWHKYIRPYHLCRSFSKSKFKNVSRCDSVESCFTILEPFRQWIYSIERQGKRKTLQRISFSKKNVTQATKCPVMNLDANLIDMDSVTAT